MSTPFYNSITPTSVTKYQYLSLATAPLTHLFVRSGRNSGSTSVVLFWCVSCSFLAPYQCQCSQSMTAAVARIPPPSTTGPTTTTTTTSRMVLYGSDQVWVRKNDQLIGLQVRPLYAPFTRSVGPWRRQALSWWGSLL